MRHRSQNRRLRHPGEKKGTQLFSKRRSQRRGKTPQLFPLSTPNCSHLAEEGPKKICQETFVAT
jgi:hypothetical protein